MASKVSGETVFVEFVDDPYLFVDFPNVFSTIVNWDLDVDIILNYKGAVIGQLNHLLIETIHDFLHNDYRHNRSQSNQCSDQPYSQTDLIVEKLRVGDHSADKAVPTHQVE